MRTTCISQTLVLAVGLFASSSAWAASDKVAGRIDRVAGEVSLSDAGGISRPATAGAVFSEGDVVVTGAEGRARLVMIEGKNVVVIGARSRLVIERAGSEARGAAPGTTLSLGEGQVRSVVKRKYSGQGSDVFEVKTPNAVAGVRGTVFLVSFDRKSARSLLATEEGAVAWRSQGQQVMVPKGQFSVVSGANVRMPASISSSPEVSAEVEVMRTEAEDKPAAKVDGAANATTSFDAEGNEVVVVESKDSSSGARAPASVGAASGASPSSAAPATAPVMPRASMGAEEQKLALTKTTTLPNQGSSPAPPSATDILRDQRAIQDQSNFVKQNSGKLNPAIVVVPLK
jgi:hypothetical protein